MLLPAPVAGLAGATLLPVLPSHLTAFGFYVAPLEQVFANLGADQITDILGNGACLLHEAWQYLPRIEPPAMNQQRWLASPEITG